jgi:hypothetical protein
VRYSKIEKRLRMMGEKEKEIRQPLVALGSTPSERRITLERMNSISIMMLGYLLAVSDLTDEQTEAYYRQFYNQARSDQGLLAANKDIGDKLHEASEGGTDENRV